MMELLSFVAMEPPVSFEAASVRGEKVKVWRAIKPISIDNTVRGQYSLGMEDGQQVQGYREEDRVDPQSTTETFAAMKLEIENWRWAGVPFYLRAGKRLAKRVTEIMIQFKQPPMLLFERLASGPCNEIQPNILTMRIQPDEGISLRFGAKVPGPDTNVCPVVMDFRYATAFGVNSANGYERLLLDAMLGDQTLFAHRDGVEATWSLYTPVLEEWAKAKPKDFPNYRSGSWGPKAADGLIGRDGRQWHRI
jgi:glucose-6-phosphate 1-dehydrogenase